MGIIVKNSIPNPNDKISDNQDLDFPTTEASTHTATKIKHKKILDIIQNIKFRTLNHSKAYIPRKLLDKFLISIAFMNFSFLSYCTRLYLKSVYLLKKMFTFCKSV